MATEIVTLHLPSELYQRLRERAEQAQRSVEEEVMDVLASAVPDTEQLTPEVEQALASLALLSDDELWQAARSHLPSSAADEIAEMNLKQQREGLTATEREKLDQLLGQYDLYMLVRAQAAVLLMRRGHDISSLAPGK